MILLNTTFSVDGDVADAFIDFIRDTYIPLASESGMYATLLTEVRMSDDDREAAAGARTFAVQMRARTQADADSFRADILPRLYELIARTWGMNVAMFESTLDVIHDPARQ